MPENNPAVTITSNGDLEQKTEGLRFMIKDGRVDEEGNGTMYVIHTGSYSARTNRRILREVLHKSFGIPTTHLKRVMKELGFKGAKLGL